mgnify:CR=1 FL=1
MGDSKASSMFGAGSAVLRGVITAPLERVRKKASGNREGPHDSVNAMIESEIIPRLLMAHAAAPARSKAKRSRPIDPEDASAFAVLPLRLEAANLLEEVDAFIAEGSSVETICLDLLAPAARMLGEMWERDECDFIDVTMGLWRLQEVMREIAARSPADLPSLKVPRSALFSPMPGDQHNFGTLMIEEVFARGGWRSEALVKPERRQLLDRIACQPRRLHGAGPQHGVDPTARRSREASLRSPEGLVAGRHDAADEQPVCGAHHIASQVVQGVPHPRQSQSCAVQLWQLRHRQWRPFAR